MFRFFNFRFLVFFGWASLQLLGFSACSSMKSVSGSGGRIEKPAGTTQLRRDIIGYAKNYIGSPYKYAGGSPKTGFDCSGFTSYVMQEFGIVLSPASVEQAKQGKMVTLEALKSGDLLFFKDGSRIQHVGLVVEHTSKGIVCIHSTTSRGVIVENVSESSYWKPRIAFARDVISK
ncbi:MAG: C40 family peptidase [Bacteroidetes bacterium]|nr:C40 family peptidase [Bacteroidota bacterium]